MKDIRSFNGQRNGQLRGPSLAQEERVGQRSKTVSRGEVAQRGEQPLFGTYRGPDGILHQTKFS